MPPFFHVQAANCPIYMVYAPSQIYNLNIYVFSRYSPHFFFQINITMIINMIYEYYYSGLDLRGAGTNAVLCKTCSVLLRVLEQPIVDNSSVGPLSAGPNWVYSWPPVYPLIVVVNADLLVWFTIDSKFIWVGKRLLLNGKSPIFNVVMTLTCADFLYLWTTC